MDFRHFNLNYRSHLPRRLDAPILDVGCGPGRVLSYLQSEGFTNVLGIDRDHLALEEARNIGLMCTQHPAPSTQHVTDLDAFLVAHAGQFDLIIAKDVIYYFPKYSAIATLSLMRNCLRPGGKLLVEVFNGASFTGPFVSYKDYQIDWIPTEHSLQGILEGAGFNARVAGFKAPRSGIRRLFFGFIQSCWRIILRGIYFAERGLDSQNPRILATKLIAIAVPQPASA